MFNDDNNNDVGIEQLEVSCRCMAMVLGNILTDQHGMIVDLPCENENGDEETLRYIVYKEGEMIQVQQLEEDACSDVESGQMVMAHFGSIH